LVILNKVKDLVTAGKYELLRAAQNDILQVFTCRFNDNLSETHTNKTISKETTVIPATQYLIQGRRESFRKYKKDSGQAGMTMFAYI
jgi:hypothetical protein